MQTLRATSICTAPIRLPRTVGSSCANTARSASTLNREKNNKQIYTLQVSQRRQTSFRKYTIYDIKYIIQYICVLYTHTHAHTVVSELNVYRVAPGLHIF